MVSTTETKTVVGEEGRKSLLFVRRIDLLSKEDRGLITEFMAYLEREGFADANKYPKVLTYLVRDGANLLNPESVKAVIAKQTKDDGEAWSNSMKMIATCAYQAFLDMKGMTWKRPIYRQDEIDVPLIDERDLDMIISVAHKKLAAFLHCLKETFADPGEIINCEWTDLNGTVLSINHPVKGHNAGKNELSGKLVGMLNSLPR